MKKNIFNNLVMVFVVIVLVLTVGCSKSSPIVPVDDIFVVLSVTHEEMSAWNSGSSYVTWVVQYTNNSDYQKDYNVVIEWGDGHTGSLGRALSPTTTVKTDTGTLSNSYLLKPGEVKMWNVKITFTHSDPKIAPIVQIILIIIRSGN